MKISHLPDLIVHRMNDFKKLQGLSDVSYGCEIDLRSDVARPGRVHLAHDPWQTGIELGAWLKVFVERGFKGPLILNTKEDGLEETVLGHLETHAIKNYFFLDTTLPTLVHLQAKFALHPFALRLSSYEPIELLWKCRQLAQWLWVDCFTAVALPQDTLRMAVEFKKETGFRICLVSPELQGGSTQDLTTFAPWAEVSDAICTKEPETWRRFLRTADVQ